ncbi:hypothetical protein KC902_01605 [Candidatus Kaiserbacteria bacterium]|nr:hypothetical protein [Candidatus Kaiserbacteria bacterium]
MDILDKEIVSSRSPIWVGFQHFILTSVTCYGGAIVLFPFSIYLAYVLSEVQLIAVYLLVIGVSVVISTHFLKEKIKTTQVAGVVVLWSTVFALLVTSYSIREEVFGKGLFTGLVFIFAAAIEYYVIASVILRKSI